MSKELFISSSPHETKIAVLEDDNLVEVFYQRDTDVGLVGGIYKGRVSRVLPGMQSAFVDVGLERDAFLYVSDFFEDSDEYDRVATEAETRVARYTVAEPVTPAPAEVAPAGDTASLEPTPTPPAEDGPAAEAESAASPEAPAVPVPPAPPSAERTSGPSRPASFPGGAGSSRWEDSRGRSRRRRRGRGFGGKYEQREQRAPERRPAEPASSGGGIELLPGESLAKYAHLQRETSFPSDEEAAGWGSPAAVDLVGPNGHGEGVESTSGSDGQADQTAVNSGSSSAESALTPAPAGPAAPLPPSSTA